MKPLLATMLLSVAPVLAAEPITTAANAINTLGVELLHRTGSATENALLSPYSIQSALVLTCVGAAGDTRAEMGKVLHYPADDTEVQRSFAALRGSLANIVQNSARDAEQMRQWGGKTDLISLTMANRLFGQTGYAFREPFLALVKKEYDAPFEPLDFARSASAATKHINTWVEDQTRKRIRNLIPDGGLNDRTRLVLVNAIYLKAPWASEFSVSATEPQPFHLGVHNLCRVPTMTQRASLSYTRRHDCTVLAIPYRGGELQFLIVLPEKVDGLTAVEKSLTPQLLADWARLDRQEVILYLPKFKLEPPGLSLGRELQALGMKSAFDQPIGSANFDRIAPRRPNEYLYLSEVFHQTFLKLDETGTEAAAATAVVMAPTSGARRPIEPVAVRVDHPFLFAIQHRASGACLFLGRVTDPR